MIEYLIVCAIFSSGVRAFVDDHVDYHNYSVVSTVASSKAQLESLRQLYLDDAVYHVDFLTPPATVGDEITFGVPDAHLEEVRRFLKSTGAPLKIKIHDLTEIIEKERAENPPQSSRARSAFALDQYHRYEEIQTYVKSLARDYPNLVQVQLIGHTFENREILAVRISSIKEKTRPVVLIDAGMHAREWVAPATALYIINLLISKYGNDTTITKLVDSFDWYIVPVANPDGYAYTWKSNRSWRKNRSRPAPFTGCYGVDPNRNFAVGFGGASTSQNPCSDLYPGTNAFSESESRAIKLLTGQNAARVRVALTLHAFGQMWMNPYGYITTKPKEYDAMLAASRKAVAALRSVYGTVYRVGSVHEVIYPTGGGSSDWQYSITNTPLVYALELRPTQSAGMLGFQLPRTQIIPTATEAWQGIKTLVENN